MDLNYSRSGNYTCGIKASDYVHIKIDEECTDFLPSHDCKMHIENNCHMLTFAEYCCKSCTLAGKL